MAPVASFPRYTVAELTVDRALYVLAVILAAAGVVWLFLSVAPTGDARKLVVVTVYAVGLIGMFVASAA